MNALIEKKQTMSEERMWNIFIQICMGLRYIHMDKRVVHRDLKPDNILLGWNDSVKITDFGLARQRNTGHTLMESSVGTMAYSCPEVITNEPYGEKADIWALGCILYQVPCHTHTHTHTHTACACVSSDQWDCQRHTSSLTSHVYRWQHCGRRFHTQTCLSLLARLSRGSTSP